MPVVASNVRQGDLLNLLSSSHFGPPAQRRIWDVVLAADFVERNAGHATFFGKVDHGFRPDEIVELAAREVQAHRFLSVNSVFDVQPPSSALNCNNLSHNFQFSAFAG